MPTILSKRSRVVAEFLEGPEAKKLRKAVVKLDDSMHRRLEEMTLKRPTKDVQRPWPSKQLVAFRMPTEEYGWGRLLDEVLTSRGWKLTQPCTIVQNDTGDREPIWSDLDFFKDEFDYMLKGRPEKDDLFPGQRILWKGPDELPSHALFFMNSVDEKDDFAKMYLQRQRRLTGPGRAYNFMAFVGSDAPLFKCNISKGFRNDDFYPRDYIMPQDIDLLQKDLKKGGKSYWIAKPNDDFGGSGITVWSHDDPDFRKLIRSFQTSRKRHVVQRYLDDPMLVGDFKFHMRIHLVITNIKPLRAYVHEGGQVLCSTRPYTLSKKTLNRNFDRAVHLTNQCFNANPCNKENYLKAKPVIGTGQQITIPELEMYLQKHCKGFNREDMWKQIVHIGKRVAQHISSWRTVHQNLDKTVDGMNFDVFGMDLMLDRHMKVWMCESNNMPGLSYPDRKILGEPNPDYYKEANMCRSVFHDTLTLLGHDSGKPQPKGSLGHFYEIDFSEEEK